MLNGADHILIIESPHEKFTRNGKQSPVTTRNALEISFQEEPIHSKKEESIHAPYGRPKKAMITASVQAHAETHAECDEEKAKLAASVKAHSETQVA